MARWPCIATSSSRCPRLVAGRPFCWPTVISASAAIRPESSRAPLSCCAAVAVASPNSTRAQREFGDGGPDWSQLVGSGRGFAGQRSGSIQSHRWPSSAGLCRSVFIPRAGAWSPVWRRYEQAHLCAAHPPPRRCAPGRLRPLRSVLSRRSAMSFSIRSPCSGGRHRRRHVVARNVGTKQRRNQ